MYDIKCDDFIGFIETIAALVHRGLHFKADQATLTITLTGGY